MPEFDDSASRRESMARVASMKPADENQDQEGGDGDAQQDDYVGQCLFQPLGSNPSGPEQDFVEVENPEPHRNAE
jgi:hypothetical protein